MKEQNEKVPYDPDTEFHIASGWLTALAVSIAALAGI